MMRTLMMKNRPFRWTSFLKYFLCFCFLQHRAQAQQHETILIQADSSWGKEVFYFPLSFAPEIEYLGFEEARFPQGWGKKDSASFWSYVFAWSIETQHPVTAIDLEQNLRDYFDGLMSVRTDVSKDMLPSTIVLLVKNAHEENGSSFKGKLQIFDAFTLKAPLILYASVEQFFCEERLTSILLFRFSPRSPGHTIWKKLNELTIRNVVLDEDGCR